MLYCLHFCQFLHLFNHYTVVNSCGFKSIHLLWQLLLYRCYFSFCFFCFFYHLQLTCFLPFNKVMSILSPFLWLFLLTQRFFLSLYRYLYFIDISCVCFGFFGLEAFLNNDCSFLDDNAVSFGSSQNCNGVFTFLLFFTDSLGTRCSKLYLLGYYS